MRKNIIPCTEGVQGPRPKTLRDVGITRIINRRIEEWAPDFGTYGMGGPGFCGFRLSKTGSFGPEWLILTLWDSTSWLLIDGKRANEGVFERLFAFQSSLPERNPWVVKAEVFFKRMRSKKKRSPGMGEWDDFSMAIIGAEITGADITDERTKIELLNGGRKSVLGMADNGRNGAVVWNPEESHLDAWVISESGYLILMS